MDKLEMIVFLLIGILIGLLLGVILANTGSNDIQRTRVLHNVCVKLYGVDYTWQDSKLNDETFECKKIPIESRGIKIIS